MWNIYIRVYYQIAGLRHTINHFVGRDFSSHQSCLGCRGKTKTNPPSTRTINKAKGGMNEMCNSLLPSPMFFHLKYLAIRQIRYIYSIIPETIGYWTPEHRVKIISVAGWLYFWPGIPTLTKTGIRRGKFLFWEGDYELEYLKYNFG